VCTCQQRRWADVNATKRGRMMQIYMDILKRKWKTGVMHGDMGRNKGMRQKNEKTRRLYKDRTGEQI
jgi:hypothetical protein